jgi:hypothetical protein
LMHSYKKLKNSKSLSFLFLFHINDNINMKSDKALKYKNIILDLMC